MKLDPIMKVELLKVQIVILKLFFGIMLRETKEKSGDVCSLLDAARDTICYNEKGNAIVLKFNLN